MSDSLWDWSLSAYAAPGVSEACLGLQDAQGHNVPLLLWSAWVAETGRRPDAETIEAACETARVWSDVAIAPLRSVRRTLKGPIADMATVDREIIREQVKAIELEAERRLLVTLETLAPPVSGAPRPTLDGLIATARVWDRVIPRPALTELAERLAGRLPA